MAAAASAAALIAAALVACGGGGGSTSTHSTTSGTTSTTATAPKGHSEQSAGTDGKGKGNAAGPSGGGGESGGSEHFVPGHHHDSGGGSAQFRVKGGDNSIQEFGAEADASELKGAAAALHDFLDARAAGDWRAACSHLAKSVVESLAQLGGQAKGGTPSCAELLGRLTNPAAKEELKKEAEQADVGSLRVEGERAFVIYRGLDGTVLAVSMTREGGAWKVGSLGGTPLS